MHLIWNDKKLREEEAKSFTYVAGDITWWLIALTALAEDPGLVLSTHMAVYGSSSTGSSFLTRPLQYHTLLKPGRFCPSMWALSWAFSGAKRVIFGSSLSCTGMAFISSSLNPGYERWLYPSLIFNRSWRIWSPQWATVSTYWHLISGVSLLLFILTSEGTGVPLPKWGHWLIPISCGTHTHTSNKKPHMNKIKST